MATKETNTMNTTEILLDESYADPEPHRELEDLEEFESEPMNTTEIHESDLRDALDAAAAVNSSSTDTFVAEVALAHWRKYPTGTPGAIKPDDNDGFATKLVDQIASGYVLTDGPWWISNDDIRALEVESGAAGDTEQVELCRAALDESDADARSICVDVIASARIEWLAE